MQRATPRERPLPLEHVAAMLVSHFPLQVLHFHRLPVQQQQQRRQNLNFQFPHMLHPVELAASSIHPPCPPFLFEALYVRCQRSPTAAALDLSLLKFRQRWILLPVLFLLQLLAPSWQQMDLQQGR